MSEAEPLSFANNFWGRDDKGVVNVFQRMHDAKQTCEEVSTFFKERIAIEEEYAKKLAALSKKGLGSADGGSLKDALDVIRRNTETMSKSHGSAGQQMRKELLEPLEAFSSSLRQRRKTVESTMDKLNKAKVTQNAAVEKARTRFEGDCNKINGYYAQQNLLMGRELEKNNMKLDKAHSSVENTKREYQNSLRVLAETIDRWNKEWKLSCDKFQDLEEERINFLKSNLWAYTNIVSTVCVSDDEGCENIRVALEKCEASKDIESFVIEKGTGSEILDPPEFINFLDGFSRDSAQNGYKVAQFSRDRADAGVGSANDETDAGDDYEKDFDFNDNATESRYDHHSRHGRDSHLHSESMSSVAGLSVSNKRNSYGGGGTLSSSFTPSLAPDHDTDGVQTSPSQNGMSPNSSVYSNNTSITSMSESEHEVAAPGASVSNFEADQQQQQPKKRTWASPFRRNRSKKDLSKDWNDNHNASTSSYDDDDHEGDTTITARSGVGKFFAKHTHQHRSEPSSATSSPKKQQQHAFSPGPQHHQPQQQSSDYSQSVLSMGDNMFDLGVSARPAYDKPSRSPSPKKGLSSNDPLLAALERLKVDSPRPGSAAGPSSPGKRASALSPPQPAFTSNEMAATSDHYSTQTQQMFDSQPEAEDADDWSSAQHHQQQQPNGYGTMPRQARPRYAIESQGKIQRPRSTVDLRSDPQQPMSTRPRPQSQYAGDQQHQGYGQPPARAVSPRPRPQSQYAMAPTQPQQQPMHHQRSKSSSPIKLNGAKFAGQEPRPAPAHHYQQHPTNYAPRAPSPNPYAEPLVPRSGARSPGPGAGGPPPQQYGPPGGQYGAPPQQHPSMRPRSKSSLDMRQQGRPTSPAPRPQLPMRARDGRPVMRHCRAAYDYRAAIPEELTFRKGDVLLVTHMQEDGWWEAEVLGSNQRPGLAPSNFLVNV